MGLLPKLIYVKSGQILSLIGVEQSRPQNRLNFSAASCNRKNCAQYFNCSRKDSLYDHLASRGKDIINPLQGESREVIRIFAFLTVIFIATGANAASSVPWSQAPVAEPLVQQVQLRCVPRYAECTLKYGEGREFRRCMRQGDCGSYRGGDDYDRGRGDCRRVNRRCRDRFGRGPDYRRCMRRRGCEARGPVRNCRRARRVCRDRFGAGPDFRRCMRRRDCL